MNASLSMLLPPHLAKWSMQFQAARDLYDVDPFVLAAICDRESRGGDALSPKGPTGTGDKGHGRGLMQIDDRFHKTFVTAVGPDNSPIWADPSFNVLYAAKLLAMNLKMYGGQYAPALAAYNAKASRVSLVLNQLGGAPEEEKLAALDKLTTGGNYVSAVMAKRDQFLMSNPTA